MTRPFAAALLAATLAGCATPLLTEIRPEPVLCLGKQQCDAMWSRAQLFVVQKTNYRLQIVTDAVIQTYGPISNYDTSLAFTVTRETAADGSGVIRMIARCGSAAQCLPPPTLAGQQFRDYLIPTP